LKVSELCWTGDVLWHQNKVEFKTSLNAKYKIYYVVNYKEGMFDKLLKDTNLDTDFP